MSADSNLALWLIPLNTWLVANLIVTFHYVIKDEGPDFLCITEIFWMILSLINTNQDRMKETPCVSVAYIWPYMQEIFQSKTLFESGSPMLGFR